MEKFGSLDEAFQFLSDDGTIQAAPNSERGPTSVSGIHVVVVDDSDSERTLLRSKPTLRLIDSEEFIEVDDDDELENVDETRIYSKCEWELLQALMKLL